MDHKKISHDIQNLIGRLRIMHDLIKDKNYQVISKEEIQVDLDEALKELKLKFDEFLQ